MLNARERSRTSMTTETWCGDEVVKFKPRCTRSGSIHKAMQRPRPRLVTHGLYQALTMQVPQPAGSDAIRSRQRLLEETNLQQAFIPAPAASSPSPSPSPELSPEPEPAPAPAPAPEPEPAAAAPEPDPAATAPSPEPEPEPAAAAAAALGRAATPRYVPIGARTCCFSGSLQTVSTLSRLCGHGREQAEPTSGSFITTLTKGMVVSRMSVCCKRQNSRRRSFRQAEGGSVRYVLRSPSAQERMRCSRTTSFTLDLTSTCAVCPHDVSGSVGSRLRAQAQDCCCLGWHFCFFVNRFN